MDRNFYVTYLNVDSCQSKITNESLSAYFEWIPLQIID